VTQGYTRDHDLETVTGQPVQPEQRNGQVVIPVVDDGTRRLLEAILIELQMLREELRHDR
jgi:hypothetical protein